MFYYPKLDPELVNVFGFFSIKWYGFLHLVGFILCYWIMLNRQGRGFNKHDVADLCGYLCIGILLGGKIGYILFYDPIAIINDPISLLTFWSPGRSFHGGLIGSIIAIWLYVKRSQFTFWQVANFIAPIVPIGIGCGRIGNFINGELWGRVTTVPWGMVFPYVDLLPRHPSQIYEFLLEGVGLYIILNYVINCKFFKDHNLDRAKSGWLLLCYGIFRYFIEFYREPDLGVGMILNYFTMGQILSIPMILSGIWILCKNT